MNKILAIILIVALLTNLVLRGLRIIGDTLFWLLILLCAVLAYHEKLRTWLRSMFKK